MEMLGINVVRVVDTIDNAFAFAEALEAEASAWGLNAREMVSQVWFNATGAEERFASLVREALWVNFWEKQAQTETCIAPRCFLEEQEKFGRALLTFLLA